MVTLKELAQFLKCSDQTVRNLVKDGLPHFRVGVDYRFFLPEVLNYLKSEDRIELDLVDGDWEDA